MSDTVRHISDLQARLADNSVGSITAQTMRDLAVSYYNRLDDATPAGPQGVRGFQGYQGLDGVHGEQGPQGDQGFQGFQGNQGVQGSQGRQGFQGNQGSQGSQGVQGVRGFQGFQGNQGSTPSLTDYAHLSIANAFTSTQTIGSPGHGAIPLTINGGGDDVAFLVADGTTPTFGITGTGKIQTNQVDTAKTVDTTGTAYQFSVYDVAGVLIGFIPVYPGSK